MGSFLFLKPEMPKCPTTGQAKGLLYFYPRSDFRPDCGPVGTLSGEKAVWEKRGWPCPQRLHDLLQALLGREVKRLREIGRLVGRKGDNFWGSRLFQIFSVLDFLGLPLSQPTSYLSSVLLFLLYMPLRSWGFPGFWLSCVLCRCFISTHNFNCCQLPLMTLKTICSLGRPLDNSSLACPKHTSLLFLTHPVCSLLYFLWEQ